MKKEDFIIHLEYREQIDMLTTEQKGMLLDALCDYAQNGETSSELDPLTKMAFSIMRARMDRDSERYEKKCERLRANGQKGGRPSKSKEEKPNGFSENQMVSEENQKNQMGVVPVPDPDPVPDPEPDPKPDIDLPEGNDIPGVKTQECNYQGVVDAFNETCVSLSRVKSLSEARRKAIRARLRQYSMDDLRTAFSKVEASPFLKGQNDRNWVATFDWVMKDTNLAKILDGNYDPRGHPQSGSSRASPGHQSYAEQHDETTRWLYEQAGGDPAVFGR